ncbi:MAG: metallophosphoesterase [Nitrospirae bacterium]|nr:metallophosphoesterase [Nitrospirota bacterium]
MKRFFFTFIFVLLLSGAAIALTDRPVSHLNDAKIIQPSTNEVTFIVLGDFRTSRRDRAYHNIFEQILREVNTIAPSLIVSTGDAYYGYGGSMQGFKNEIDYFLSKIKDLDVPFFSATGNHEVAGDAERERYAEKRFGRLYGSFDYGNMHFIMLNTDEVGKQGTISGEQLKWLEKDLETNKNAGNIFVFMHRPMFSVTDPELVAGKSFKDKGNRDYLHSLFNRYKVKSVFAGHEHIFNETVKDGVRYFITGGAGSPLYQPPGKGGFFHYLIVKVNGRDVSIDVVVPYTIQTRTISGNDGFESKAEIEIANISFAGIDIRNLQFIMPAAAADKYRVRATSISKSGQTNAHAVRIRHVKDNKDGTATVSVETQVPKNGLIRVVVEVDI